MAKIVIEKKISHLIKKAVIILSKSLPIKQNLTPDLQITLDITKDPSHGDLTTNIAMRLTRFFSLDAFSIAGKIRSLLEDALRGDQISKMIESIEVKKPGYINFWLSKECLYNNLKFIKKQNKIYGGTKEGALKKIQIEFVSANPTGPLTVAHGRQAAIGDALSRILRFSGYKVHKEYFVNDEGKQIDALGESILYHYLSFHGVNIEFPEDGYKGEYILDIARQIKEKVGNRFVKNYKKKFFSDYGVNYILGKIKKDLKDFGVYFDTWYNQSSLTKSRVDSVIEVLRKRNYIYQKDGATWFKSQIFGDEKDRVVVKSDGTFTYFAPDIAYHLNKYKKGFKHLIDIWGPDHHGYVPRLKAAIKALGYSEDSISTLLVQLATLYRDGEILSMSTRKGEFITLREIMTEVGKDVAKFFFLMRKLDSHLDFDLEVAKGESQDNPVYYIQYAHARIWSIKDFEKKAKSGIRAVKTNLNLLRETEELELSRLLYQFPRCVQNSAKNLEPYYIIMYLNGLAKVFHNFYTKHRVIGDDLALSKARLFLIDCVRICLANGLSLLGVSLPKRM